MWTLKFLNEVTQEQGKFMAQVRRLKILDNFHFSDLNVRGQFSENIVNAVTQEGSDLGFSN